MENQKQEAWCVTLCTGEILAVSAEVEKDLWQDLGEKKLFVRVDGGVVNKDFIVGVSRPRDYEPQTVA